MFDPQAEVAEDVNLIWTNCMLYNMDGSDFHKLATKFQQRADDLFSKVVLWHRLNKCCLPPVTFCISPQGVAHATRLKYSCICPALFLAGAFQLIPCATLIV